MEPLHSPLMHTWVWPLQAVRSGWKPLPALAAGHVASVPVHCMLALQSVARKHVLDVAEKVQPDSQHGPWEGLQVAPGAS